MHSTTDAQATATRELNSYLEVQAQEIAPEPIRVKTPQRKARYHDPMRFRLKSLKEAVLLNLKCTTDQIKDRLQEIGVKLDLRLTSAWVAIQFELMPLLDKAIAPAFQIGDPVIWTQCPATMVHIEKWFPLRIVRCDRKLAVLDMLAFPVPLTELELAVA